MSATDHKEFLYITETDTPRCYKIHMKKPMEFSEAWANIHAERNLDHDVLSSVDEIFHDPLFEMIGEALIADSVAEECTSTSSGLFPLKGLLRETKLTKLEQIRLAEARASSLRAIAEKYGTEGFSGCSIITDSIPTKYAEGIRDEIREKQNGLLNCRNIEKNEAASQVRVAMLMQIKKLEE